MHFNFSRLHYDKIHNIDNQKSYQKSDHRFFSCKLHGALLNSFNNQYNRYQVN